VSAATTGWKAPKGRPKGSGRKGDNGNPKDRSKPRPLSQGGRTCTVPTSKNNEVLESNERLVQMPPCRKRKCNIRANEKTNIIGAGRNTLRIKNCISETTHSTETVITSFKYAHNAVALPVTKTCSSHWSQACYHYSSAIKVNPQWATLTCPEEAAQTKYRLDAKATDVWSIQHKGIGWKSDNPHFQNKQFSCDRDEYPPAYLLNKQHPAYVNSGKNSNGQLVRLLPAKHNGGAGSMWKGVCFATPLDQLSIKEFQDKAALARNKQVIHPGPTVTRTMVDVVVTQRPEFSIKWTHDSNPPANAGLDLNPCWPSNRAAKDPGFALLTYDPYYGGNPPPYDYKAMYVQGTNGE
jgi:hypothetical protein